MIIITEAVAFCQQKLYFLPQIIAAEVFAHGLPQEQADRQDATPEHRQRCQDKLDVLLEQQRDLSTAIDQLLDDIEAGRKVMKVYRQMKMYNDPATNPVLYKKS